MLKNNFAPPGAPVLPVAAVLIFTFYRSTQCTNEWLPPSTAPTPYLCHVCHALMTGPGRPGPAGLDRRPKEPPGARDGRRTAAGAAPAGRGTGLVPGCRHMLQTCYAITTLTTAAGLLTSDFRRVTVHRRSGLAPYTLSGPRSYTMENAIKSI